MTAHARGGRIHAELPLFVAIRTAERRMNPFAELDTHPYRAIDATAWIRDGGRTLHMVYSGRNRRSDGVMTVLDAFCVRRLRIPERGP